MSTHSSIWFNPGLIELLVDLVPAWVAIVLAILSYLGSAVVLLPLLIGWYLLRPTTRTLAWFGYFLAAVALRAFAKRLNDIERPAATPDLDPALFPWLIEQLYVHSVDIDTTGFPSGHMIAGIVFWGLLAKDLQFSTSVNRWSGAIGVILLIAITRILLGAHWIEDVVAGAILGLLLLTIIFHGRRRFHNEVEFSFGLAFLIAAVDVILVGSLSSQVVLPVTLGAFIGIALTPRLDGSMGEASIGRAPYAIGVATAVLLFGLALGRSTLLVGLIATPIIAVGMHWRSDQFRDLHVYHS